jgi:hypothetical protein
MNGAFSSHYPSIIISNGIGAEADISQIMFDDTLLVAVSDTIPLSKNVE